MEGLPMNAGRFLMMSALLAVVLSLAACQSLPGGGGAESETAARARADSLARLAQLDRGKEGFIAYCAMCHGDGGNGDGDAAAAILKRSGVTVARLNDRELVGELSEAQVRDIIANGGSHTGRSNLMPAWGEKLDPGVIADIASFVKVLADSNPAIPMSTIQRYVQSPPGVPADGRPLFLAHCSACHGPNGKGDGTFADALWKSHQVRPRDLTDSTYLATRTDRELFATISLGGGHFRKSTFMPSWTGELSPEQIKSIVAYVRVLSNTKPQP